MKRLNGYNFLAPFYDQLASVVFGKELWVSQCAFIDEIRPGAHVLVLGGGTGRIAEAILNLNSTCVVSFVEASSEMIAIARRRLPGESRIQFIHGTDDNLPDHMFDAVVTGFFVDQFSEGDLEAMIIRIRQKINPGGIWLVTDFIDERWWHRVALRFMYVFFHLTAAIPVAALPPWEVLFSKRIKQVAEKRFCRGFVKSILYRI